jgi:hypothetical protein
VPFDVALDEFEIGDLEIVKLCKRNVDFFVAAFLALDLQRSASIADALPGQLRGAAMIGQGGFDRLDVVECETPLSALDVTDFSGCGSNAITLPDWPTARDNQKQ